MHTRDLSSAMILGLVASSVRLHQEAEEAKTLVEVPLTKLPYHVKHALRDALREFTSENNKPEHFECSCDLCGQYTARVAEISQWARMGM